MSSFLENCTQNRMLMSPGRLPFDEVLLLLLGEADLSAECQTRLLSPSLHALLRFRGECFVECYLEVVFDCPLAHSLDLDLRAAVTRHSHSCPACSRLDRAGSSAVERVKR